MAHCAECQKYIDAEKELSKKDSQDYWISSSVYQHYTQRFTVDLNTTGDAFIHIAEPSPDAKIPCNTEILDNNHDAGLAVDNVTRKIIELAKQGKSYRYIAGIVGKSHMTVSRIIKGVK